MNRQEFIEYVKRSQKSLRRFLVSVCSGDVPLAEDIAQETYMKAYLAFENIPNLSNFNAWIIRTGYNTFLNQIRNKHINIPIEEAKGYAAEENAENDFRYESLYQALDSLPAKERSVIVLFYLEGYASKEIADILEISDDAVRQSLSRGRRKLKSLLE